jgi:2-methylisocitrate lyase-like PEP mutase family enzyme
MFISDRKSSILATAPHAMVEVLPRDEYLGKMRAVLEARNKEDKDFVIAARIDAGATLGDEEVLARAKACTELGVDVILPYSIPPESNFEERDKETLKRLYKKIGAPEVLIWGMGPNNFTAKDYEDVGAKLWVSGNPIPSVAESVLDLYQRFHDTGALPAKTFSTQPGKGSSRDSLQKLRGLDFWVQVEKRNKH